ncbi:MAG: DUF4340 domain-containing protein [Spirochaetia bacterium]|nr:DUF4340 domain-containing protein [Spirochaetia bacterium]
MTYRNKMILLSTLALLLMGTYFLGPLLTSSDSRRLSPQPWLQNVDAGSITKIEFLNQEFALIHSEAKGENNQQPAWFVALESEKFPADSKKVKAFTDRIANLAFYSEAAASPDNWSKYSVDDGNGLKLKIFTNMDGEAQETIVFGDSLQGSDRQYARKISSDSVYVVDDLRRYLERETGYWSDLALFSEKLSIQDVMALEFITKEDGQFRFRRSEEGLNQIKWSLTSEEAAPKVVDPEVMNRHIRNLIELHGEKYATRDERSYSGITDPHTIISFETTSGNTYKLRIGNKNNRQQVYVRPLHSQYTYLVSQWRLNTVLNPLKELLQLQDN